MELTAERRNASLQRDWHISFWSKLRFSFILASSFCSWQSYQFPLIYFQMWHRSGPSSTFLLLFSKKKRRKSLVFLVQLISWFHKLWNAPLLNSVHSGLRCYSFTWSSMTSNLCWLVLLHSMPMLANFIYFCETGIHESMCWIYDSSLLVLLLGLGLELWWCPNNSTEAAWKGSSPYASMLPIHLWNANRTNHRIVRH